MRSMELGYKYYSCGFVTDLVRDLPFRANSLNGLTRVVADNYGCATREELEILETLDHVVAFGTLGPIHDAVDYRTPSSDQWMRVIKDVDEGLISLELALRDFNFTQPEA